MTMGHIVLDVSMSLDGFVAGPNDEVDRLHHWAFGGKTDTDAEIVATGVKAAGAVVMGRRTFDLHPSGPYGLPAFVVTHDAPKRPATDHSAITYVTDGVESALAQATAAAGDKSVVVMGADIARQCMRKRLLDELHIHLVPVLLVQGIRLFEHLGHDPIELERTSVIPTPAATHLTFRARGQGE
jgi:dihydrofolate reductase